MEEYINKKEIIRHLCLTTGCSYYDVVIGTIMKFPAADVQSVVCCKDCKYAQNPNDTMVYCTYFECGTMSQNDFCSQGERRTENG